MTLDEIHDVEVKDINVSNLNVRLGNFKEDLDELAESIKQYGLLQPIVLRGTFGNPPYDLIAGQRRFLAHQKLRKRKIRAVFSGVISDTEALILSLVENLQSVELNHADTARAITQLYNRFGKDEREVQKQTGLSIRKIRDYIDIESQSSAKMKKMLADGKVAAPDIKRALRAAQGEIAKAEKLLDIMSTYPLTKHQKKRVVEYGQEHARATAEKILQEAVKPRVEQSIIVSLPEVIRLGLEKATKALSQDPDEIVTEVLQFWLSEQGFIDG